MKKNDVLSAINIGVEFEFYSKNTIEKTAKSIGEKIGKKIIVPYAVGDIKNPKPLYHSPIESSSDMFKLEPDYSGGPDMRELITGVMDYKEARRVIISMFEWIRDNGYTNDRCSIHVNMSVNNKIIKTNTTIQNMNILKFILDFNEKAIYDVFPDREHSVYARTIKSIYPNDIVFYSSFHQLSRNIFHSPDEKYYGVNFLKAEKGYLEYRYMGGKNYHLKTRKILELVDEFALHLYNTLQFNGVPDINDIRKFEKYTAKQREIIKGFVSPVDFQRLFPEIKIQIDLKDNIQILKTYWSSIKSQLYKLLLAFKLEAGTINYDADIGILQIQEAKLSGGTINGVQFFNCKLEGIFENCWFYDCDIKNSRVHQCNTVRGNNITSSKIMECHLNKSNGVISDCFIENKTQIIDCTVEGGVIRNGEIGVNSKISKETLIVESKEPTESPGSFKRVKK
jgi:hypothetical protein